MASLPLLLAFALAPTSTPAASPVVPQQARETTAQFLARFKRVVRNAPNNGIGRAVATLACNAGVFDSSDDPLALYSTRHRREFKQEVASMTSWNGGALHFNVGEDALSEMSTATDFTFQFSINGMGRYCIYRIDPAG